MMNSQANCLRISSTHTGTQILQDMHGLFCRYLCADRCEADPDPTFYINEDPDPTFYFTEDTDFFHILFNI